MRHFLRALTIAAALAASGAADAGVRDVQYYMARPGELGRTLQVCHGNAAYADLPDCRNAEGAAAGLMGRRAAQAMRPLGTYFDPAWWSANPVARAGVLAQCRRRGPGDELVYSYCTAAAASAMADLNSGRR